ncbi:hypothetical protein AFLA_002277 [Aspergillus flavus NRRL3357]|nr:hypothetical protein AFLA_002277 [Aspergillus flavus NRRL3357]
MNWSRLALIFNLFNILPFNASALVLLLCNSSASLNVSDKYQAIRAAGNVTYPDLLYHWTIIPWGDSTVNLAGRHAPTGCGQAEFHLILRYYLGVFRQKFLREERGQSGKPKWKALVIP